MEESKMVKKIANEISELVGNTPLIYINKLSNNLEGKLIAKLESFNPVSSVKDRIAVGMIENAEKNGLIDKNTTLIEPTSGNTGIALGAIAASRGYKLILTMPENMSEERKKLLTIFGAKIILTPAVDGMKGAINKANELLDEIDNSFSFRQFSNPVNVETHYKTTANEIWDDTNGDIDVIVAGVGTGGTIIGISKKLKEKNPNLISVAVEPLTSAVLSGEKPSSHKIQGIGAGFIPDIYENDLIDEIIQVSDENAGKMMLDLAKKEGILAGISSGAAIYAGIELAKRKEFHGKKILAILPDTGERYLSMDWIFKDISDNNH